MTEGLIILKMLKFTSYYQQYANLLYLYLCIAYAAHYIYFM